MTDPLFRTDAYQKSCLAHVTGHTEDGGIIVDASVFYPQGGGQPGDSGELTWDGGRAVIENTVKSNGEFISLVPENGSELPAEGAEVTMTLDWDRRSRHMRVHTALHLLSVVVPLPVTGGAITAVKGRLDFAMPDPIEDKEALAEQLNDLIARDLEVSESWITDEELAANPGLVKTMSVMPPSGAGRVRLIRIGRDADQVDLQPCGGTHVARTGEIGRIRFGKLEKKGKINRRVNLHLDEPE